MIEILSWIGAVLGVLGSFLVTSRQTRVRYISFWTGAISSIVLMIVYSQDSRMYPLIGMTTVYCVADVFGIWNNRPSRSKDLS